MLFSKKVSDELYELYKNDERLIITACNGMGQEFSVVGKIATVEGHEVPCFVSNLDANYAGIMNHCIFIECAYKKDEYRSEYCTVFYNTLEYCEVGSFYIKDIKLKKTGRVVYENKGYNTYYETGRENLIEYGKIMLENKQTPAMFNGIGSELNQFIGQPINIYGNKGILAFVDNAKSGKINLYYSDFGHLFELEIPKNSIVTQLKNGIIKITENKNKYQSFEDFLYGSKK